MEELFYDALPFFSDDLELHQAAFENDGAKVDALIKSFREEGTLEQRLEQTDSHGMTPLMIATWKKSLAMVGSLLAVGADPRVKRKGWRAYHLAIEVGECELAAMLLEREVELERLESKRKKEKVLSKLKAMPDASFSLSWEIGSSFPGLGLIIRSLAPSDTYHIVKKGDSTRVDGSLMGLSKKATKSSVLPQWKKGQFSLIHNPMGDPSSPSLVFIDRLKARYIDVNAWRKKASSKANAEIIATHVQGSMESKKEGRVVKSKIKVPDLKFKPMQSGWLSSKPLREEVDEWDCQVLQSSVELFKEVKTKAPFPLNIASWQEYLDRESLTDEGDDIIIQPLDPLSKGNGKGRNVSAKMWMASGFPISLDHLLPIIDIIGSAANSTLSKVSQFISRVASQDYFPVKIVVPLAFTVYVQIQIKSFALLDKTKDFPDDFFSVPSAFALHEPKVPESFLNKQSSDQASMEEDQSINFEASG